MKVRIEEAILVEGRYDKNTLSQIVDTAIFEAGGFRIFRDREMVDFLRRVAQQRGLIILTDSDGAGFVIRNRLKSMLPRERVKHAYIPDLPGKEKRKKTPSKEGLLGVEGMTPEIILEALRRSGATFPDETAPARAAITRQDLYRMGLTGGKDSASRREYVKQRLMLPGHLGTNAFLDALNLITDRRSLEKLLAEREDLLEQTDEKQGRI